MRKIGYGLAASLVTMTMACGGDFTPTTMPPVTDTGSSIWNSSVQTLVVENHGGGFTPQPPPGSTCLVGAKKFTLTVATSALAWTRCVGDGKTAYTETSGGRTLTAAEMKSLDPVLGELKVVKPDGACITDSPILTVTVTTPVATQEYVDSGSQCSTSSKPLLTRDAIQGSLDKLNTLAGP